MRLPLHTLLLAGLLSAGPVALAAPAAPAAAAAEVNRLEAECARLRSELARANADVAALKKDRGVRSDYKLRQRMADAEALARKLTDAEAQLRARTGAAPAAHAPALAPPSAEPGDGPVELEAKADLLSDQARRLAAEADGLLRTAGELRGRQTLRKRASQLERDPFASMDGSKRTLVFGGSLRATTGKGGTSNESAPKSPQPGGGAMDSTTTRGGSGGASGGGSAPTTGPAPPTAQPGMGSPGAAPPPMGTPPAQTPPAGGGAKADFAGPAPQPTSALASQLRTLLDPSTLSEVQRLERTGKPVTDPESLEKLAAALRQRAQALDAQSKSLRAKARP